jgi:hypothetical protein
MSVANPGFVEDMLERLNGEGPARRPSPDLSFISGDRGAVGIEPPTECAFLFPLIYYLYLS